MLIGLTGTFGSGKSTVASLFMEYGAAVIDADALAREVTASGGVALVGIRREFGDEMFFPDGTLNRAKLAQVVFCSPHRREALNQIVHPLVIAEMDRRIVAEKNAVILLDIPLLFEAGLNHKVERIVVVTTSESQRFRRARVRDNMTEQEVIRRLASQWPQREKVRLADVVIDNSGSFEMLRVQVRELYELWLGKGGMR
jgi:dephospho-CoA kinase